MKTIVRVSKYRYCLGELVKRNYEIDNKTIVVNEILLSTEKMTLEQALKKYKRGK